MEANSRAQAVLADLKLIASLSSAQSTISNHEAESRRQPFPKIGENTFHDNNAPVQFPSASSKLSQPSPLLQTPVFQRFEGDQGDQTLLHPDVPRSPLAMARTFKRSISGGFSNILKPFHSNTPKEVDQVASTKKLQPQPFKKIRKSMSLNFTRTLDLVGKERVPPSPKYPPISTGTRRKNFPYGSNALRESFASRDSTASILEYLAERRLLEENEIAPSMLIPLHEYGRNCHKFGCDTPHIWNPDKNSSAEIIHCGCDSDNKSDSHLHIEDLPSPTFKLVQASYGHEKAFRTRAKRSSTLSATACSHNTSQTLSVTPPSAYLKETI